MSRWRAPKVMAIYPPIEPPITNARFEGTRLFTASVIASIAVHVK
jgi:hypothetical protein